MILALIPAALFSMFAISCSKGIQNEAAVRQGVVDYLSKRGDLSLSNIQFEVTSVSFRQNEADATVSFRAKGSSTAMMTMHYTLERQGNRWVVKGRGRSGAGMPPHGEGMQPGMQPGEAPQTPGGDSGNKLPPGHPPLGGDSAPPPSAPK